MSSNILKLIDESLEGPKEGPKSDRNFQKLKLVLDIYVKDSEKLSDEQIELFDDIICKFTSAIETWARIELSEQLSTTKKAPPKIVKTLANDEIKVAGPILKKSNKLSETDLIEIVNSKGIDYMMAICERNELSEPLTDVLISKGEPSILDAIVENEGAKLSKEGLMELIDRSPSNTSLHLNLAKRTKLEVGGLGSIIKLARERAMQKLVESSPREAQSLLNKAIASGAKKVQFTINYNMESEKKPVVKSIIKNAPNPQEEKIKALCRKKQFKEAVGEVANIMDLSVATVEGCFQGQYDLLLVICKAEDWEWDTLATLINAHNPTFYPGSSKKMIETYDKLTAAAAIRVREVMKTKDAVGKSKTGS